MSVQPVTAGPMKYACVQHTGAYNTVGKAFENLCAWMGEAGIEPAGPAAAFFMDDPATVPEDQLRSYAGIRLKKDQTVSDPAITVLDVPMGTYAVKTHLGPYEGLGAAWQTLFESELAAGGMVPDGGLCFEMYMNDCNEVAPEEIRTDIYVSIK